MSRELESRLEGAFAELPDPAPDVEARARRAALGALGGRRRGPRALGVVAVAVAGAGIAALSLLGLRATGTINLEVGARARAQQHPVGPSRLLVPRGAHGIAAVVDGRLWLSTRRGVRVEGLPVSAAGLSPHALYVGVGLGHSLVAMAPDRRLAWTHATTGAVTAVTWAPDGLRVAYIVRTGNRYALRMIEGDGDHDELLDASVRPVRPEWRADSLALAYVGAGGRAIVLDVGRRSRRVLGGVGCGAVEQVAFPDGEGQVAAAARNGVMIDGRCLGRTTGSTTDAVAWLGSDSLVVAGASREAGPTLLRMVVAGRRAAPGPVACVAARVQTLATWPQPNGVALAVHGGSGLEVRALTRASGWGDCPEIRSTVLLALPDARRVTSLDVR
jgi:hypothetical protein